MQYGALGECHSESMRPANHRMQAAVGATVSHSGHKPSTLAHRA